MIAIGSDHGGFDLKESVIKHLKEKELGRLYGEDEQKDGQFLQMVQESAAIEDACAFLLGEGFHGEWSQDSLRLLCHNRRVFKGNDLYSKGACFGMQDKLADKKQTEMIFSLPLMVPLAVSDRARSHFCFSSSWDSSADLFWMFFRQEVLDVIRV